MGISPQGILTNGKVKGILFRVLSGFSSSLGDMGSTRWSDQHGPLSLLHFVVHRHPRPGTLIARNGIAMFDPREVGYQDLTLHKKSFGA